MSHSKPFVKRTNKNTKINYVINFLLYKIFIFIYLFLYLIYNLAQVKQRSKLVATVTESHYASVEAMDYHFQKECDEFMKTIYKVDKESKFIFDIQYTDHYKNRPGQLNTETAKIKLEVVKGPFGGKVTNRNGDMTEMKKRRYIHLLEEGKNPSEDVILGETDVICSAFNKEGVNIGNKSFRIYFHNIDFIKQQDELYPISSFYRVCPGCTEHSEKLQENSLEK